VSFKPGATSRRIAFAFAISLLLHSLIMWGSNIQLPHFKSSLPTLTAKLEALPSAAPAKPKYKAKPAVKNTPPEPAPQTGSPPQDIPLAASAVVASNAVVAASEPVAASAAVETGTLAAEAGNATERTPLPRHAQLTFDVNKGTGHFRVGEAIHTLEINAGRYVLHAVTKTVGLVKLFKSFELTQNSSGSYNKYGLQPEQFVEERKEKSGTQSIMVEFDHTAQRAHFSQGGETVLPPDTQDILSIMYQFPPLQNVGKAAVSVSNGKKIEHYEFKIVTDEEIETAIGKLLTVRLSKLHAPDEEGLEIWLAREYRLFPVKIRFIEKNGEITGEAVITDIRVSEEQGVRNDVAN
jgi:hypothetical protein